MSSEVPEGWSRRPLTSVAEISRGTSWTRENEVRQAEEGALPVVGIRNVRERLDLSNLIWLRGLRPSVIASSIVQSGDILMVGSNGNPDRIGNAVQVDAPGTYLFASLLFGLRPRKEAIGADFLYYAVTSPAFQTQISDAVQGTTGLSNLKISTLRAMDITLPPLDEQRRIAEVLRSVDVAIDASAVTLDATVAMRQCALDTVMQEQVEALDGTMRLLSEVAEIRTGLAKNKNVEGRHRRLPYLRVANVQNGWFNLSDMREIDVEPSKIERYMLRSGDVLLTEGGDYDKLGRGGVWNAEIDPCLHQNHIFCVRSDRETILPEFLAFATQSFLGRNYFLSCAKRTTNLASINSSQLRALPLPVPDLERQRIAVDIISGLDATIRAAQEHESTLKRLRASLLSDLLSGRVRVPTADTLSAVRSVQPAFKRAVFAAEIVHQLHKDAKFGSVKHEKIVHLCELHLGLQDDLDRHAYKEAAGPYDPKARRSVEAILRQQRWFATRKAGGQRIIYDPLEKCGSHRSYFDRYFGNRERDVQKIIDLLRPLDTQRCEIIATLYAAWNDFLIDGRQPSDDEIVASVLDDWHPAKQQIEEARWRKALPWMRQKGLVPRGTGEKTRVTPK